MTKPQRNGLLLGLVLGIMGWTLLLSPWWSRPLDELTEYHDVPSCVHQGRLP